MRTFEIVQLAPGQHHTFARISKKEKLILGQGQCRIQYHGATLLVERGANMDLTSESGHFEVIEVVAPSILIRMCGDWGDELGGSGLFTGKSSEHPQDNGDPVAYRKETNFDNHYHDCDEYWILFEGSGAVVSEGKHYEVSAGDCVATGMGHHHNIQRVGERIEAVFFETTLEGQKRRGHLWDHTHGLAHPKAERV